MGEGALVGLYLILTVLVTVGSVVASVVIIVWTLRFMGVAI